jgi:hypothetical protein
MPRRNSSHRFFGLNYEGPAIKAAVEILSYQYRQAKETNPNLIIDMAVVKRIEQSGFIKALDKK